MYHIHQPWIHKPLSCLVFPTGVTFSQHHRAARGRLVSVHAPLSKASLRPRRLPCQLTHPVGDAALKKIWFDNLLSLGYPIFLFYSGLPYVFFVLHWFTLCFPRFYTGESPKFICGFYEILTDQNPGKHPACRAYCRSSWFRSTSALCQDSAILETGHAGDDQDISRLWATCICTHTALLIHIHIHMHIYIVIYIHYIYICIIADTLYIYI